MKLITLLTIAAIILSTEIKSYAQATICDSLNTVYNSTGTVKYGVMFNVIADSSVTLTHLTSNINDGTALLKIYYRNGSFIGHESQPSAWTLIGSSNVLSNNTITSTNIPTVIPINFNLNMVAGDTIAFYLECPQLSFIYLTSTTIPWGTTYVNDSSIQISVARSVFQEFGVPFSTPHIWNGSVSYCSTQAVGIGNIKNDTEFKVFQTDNSLIVNLDEALASNSEMKMSLFNAFAQNVMNCQLNSSYASYDLYNISDGVYFCVLYRNNVQAGMKKISIHKH